MFQQSTKSIRRAVSMSCILLFILMALCGLTRAQSQDPANPTPITSSTVEGQAGPAGATYYYRFNAPKGSVTVALKGQTNYYSTQFEADLRNTNGDDLGKIYVNAGDTAKSESKEFSFDSQQSVTIVVKLLKDDTLKWQKYNITLSGAVSFGESGGGKDESTADLPDLAFTSIEYVGDSVNFCVKNIGKAKARYFQVRLGGYAESDIKSDVSYVRYFDVQDGLEVNKAH